MADFLRCITATLVVCLSFLGSDAQAQKAKYNPFTLMKSLKKEKKKSGARGAGGPKRLREGGFKTIQGSSVAVAGGGQIKLSDIIKANFGAAQKKAGARGAKRLKSRGLYVKPAVEEHAIETKDSFVVSRRTTYVVTDPKKHGAKGHRAKKGARGGRANKRVKKNQYKLNTVPAKHRKFYTDVIIPSIPKLPKDHPLRKAYDKGGMAAFLNAFADGKGDYQVNDEVIIPKGQPALENGRVRFPGIGKLRRGARGKKVRFHTTKKINWMTNLNTLKKKDAVSKPQKKYSYQETGGELSYEHKFLTGWTWSRHWEKKHHKDYWLLEYKFWATAGFTIGFRVPVKFKGKMSPAYVKTFSNRKSGDKKGSFSVKLSADVFDGPTSYYESVGWKDKDPKARGKEFPFHLYLNAGAFVEVFGKDILNKKIGFDLDYSQELKPVYGKNQVLKMKGPRDKKFKNAAFYIPSDITRTKWRVGSKDLWAAAEGLIGAEFGGDGSVSAKIQPVIDGKLGKGQTISVTRGETKTAGPFSLKKMKNFGKYNYGYKISDPRYKWVVKIRPAIKANVSGECDYWWCGYAGPKTYTLGPWYPMGWIKLGTINLKRHKSTTKSYTVKDGKKEFIKENAKGASSMYVCLKAHKGQYVHASSDRLPLAFAQFRNCGGKTTFKLQSVDASGKKSNSPIMQNRYVSIQTVYGRYLSIDKDGKFVANATKVGKKESFEVLISGAKKKQTLKVGDRLQLRRGTTFLRAKKAGGGKIVGKDGKKATKNSSLFTIVESKKRNFSWTCKDGKRDGHSNCSVKKISSLKHLKDTCKRDAKKCPCYIKKAKNSKTGEVWCLEKVQMAIKLPGRSTIKKKLVSAAHTLCSKKAKRQKGRVNSAKKNQAVAFNSTECRVATFSAKAPGAKCSAVSSDTTSKSTTGKQTFKFMYFKQSQGSCPYWVSSKYKQIAARAIPEFK